MIGLKKSIVALFVASGLTACGGVETATRGASLDAPTIAPQATNFELAEVRVAVPEALRVSEANLYYPVADIVWRDDPLGNRHQQVRNVFAGAAAEAIAQSEGSQKVAVDVEVVRFHSLTEKARYTVGGVHSIRFLMTVRDQKTGAILVPTRLVRADLDAYGGRRALEAEAKGNTQKVRITNHLTAVLQAELSGRTSS